LKTERRIIMAKSVASRWVESHLQAEHRLVIFGTSSDIRKLPNLLRSFRDGKIAMSEVSSLPDLGIQESFDQITVWSTDRVALKTLANWFEKRGMETSGVW